MSKIKINNSIDIQEMWEGLGNNFDSIQQIIFEFIDNSCSNILSNMRHLSNKQINLVFSVKNDNAIEITVEDSGTGIKNLDNAFKIGNKASQESPLNEHGFGMKHALAAADKTNSNWWIATRTKNNFKNNQFVYINAPYKTINFEGDLKPSTDWPGTINSTGTIISFLVDKSLLATATAGIPGANESTSYNKIIGYIIEDIAFTYSNIIDKDGININVKLFNNNSLIIDQNVTPLKPDWEKVYKEGETNIDLGNGIVKIEYQFGSIKPGSNLKYYKRNMKSSGAEIRLNGRVLLYNLLSNIWHIAQHNDYNHFIAIINVISDDRKKLPSTKTSKNSFNYSDEKYETLIEWIGSIYPKVPKIITSGSYDEVQLFEELKRKFEIIPEHKNDTYNLEQYVFEEIGMKLRIDLYSFVDNKIIIYEGKKSKTTPQDVYQLRMYWDGLVFSRKKPQKGILLGDFHPESVLKMIDFINKMKDANGNFYKIETRVWSDYNLNEED